MSLHTDELSGVSLNVIALIAAALSGAIMGAGIAILAVLL